MSKTKSCFKVVRENLLFLLLLLGVIFGFLLGIFLNEKVQQSEGFTPKELAMLIGFPGELFLRMMFLVVIPFTTSSVITSLTLLDKKSAGKLGKRMAVCFLIMSLIASSLAVVLGKVFIKPLPPTHNVEKEERDQTSGSRTMYAVLDMLRNMIPDNIVEASISSTSTKLQKKVTVYKLVNKSAAIYKSSAGNLSSFLKKEVINPWSVSPNSVQVIKEENAVYEYAGQEKYNSANLLGILVFSILVGIILNGLGEKGKPIVNWCRCLFDVIMKMVDLFIWFSPIGISSIIASSLVAMKDIKGTMESLGIYIATVIIASIIFGFVILPILYAILLRRNPFRLLICVSKALFTALGTASSAATIPITLSCLEKKKCVDGRLAQFMLPIGTVMSLPGTAIYIALSAIFIVQTFHSNLLTLSSLILICFTSSIATLAGPLPGAVPIACLGIVLQAIGIPKADIGLILAIDWLIDRITTPISVWANCIACVIVEHYSREQLQSLDDVIPCEPRDSPATAGIGFSNTVAIDIADEEEETIEKLEKKDNNEDIVQGA